MPKNDEKSEIEGLSERKKAILRAIVDIHIKEGEPVGSKSLTEDRDIGLSPATIRAEMAALTELGYLEQPHVSAGRVPSEAGYRFYVEQLMKSYVLTAREIAELNHTIALKAEQLDRILTEAGRVVAALTNYPVLSTGPANAGRKLVGRLAVHIVDAGNMLLIMLPENKSGTTKSKMIPLKAEMSVQESAQLEALLNSRINGKELSDISYAEVKSLEREAGVLSGYIEPILQAVIGFFSEESPRISVDGMDKLLSYPEFSDAQRLAAVLGGLDNKAELMEIVRSGGEEDRGISIYIGSENPVDNMHTSSLVLKTIKVGGREVGTIGVIGPRRMNYSKVVSTMEYLAQKIAYALDEESIPAIEPPIKQKE